MRRSFRNLEPVTEGVRVPSRVLVLSDPTRSMGALAEPECRRIISALELGKKLQMPVEWVAVSAGAKIDWESGTKTLIGLQGTASHYRLHPERKRNQHHRPRYLRWGSSLLECQFYLMMHTKGLDHDRSRDHGTYGKRASTSRGVFRLRTIWRWVDIPQSWVLTARPTCQRYRECLSHAQPVLPATYVARVLDGRPNRHQRFYRARHYADPYPDNLCMVSRPLATYFHLMQMEPEEAFRSPTDHASGCRPRCQPLSGGLVSTVRNSCCLGNPHWWLWDPGHRDRKPTTARLDTPAANGPDNSPQEHSILKHRANSPAL